MKKLLTSALALAIVASAGAANAQPGSQRNDNRYEQRDDRRDDRTDRRDDRADRRDDRRDDRAERRDDRRDDRADRRDDRYERRAERRYRAARYQAPRGYTAQQWRRGERLPASYRSRAYVVDHRRYALAPPPRGYHYVRVGDDVALTAITTGIISSVILQLFQQ